MSYKPKWAWGRNSWWHQHTSHHAWQPESGSANSEWQSGTDDDPGDPWYIDSHDLIFEPRGAGGHCFTLVLLHSCSGGPDDWLPYVHRLRIPFRNNIRIVVPCAPLRREVHFGWAGEMNSWFEYADEGDRLKYPMQLQEERTRILQLIDRERMLLPCQDACRLVIGGLSQGAGLAVDVAIQYPLTLGGVLSFRGAVLRETLDFLEQNAGTTHHQKIYAYHGERDNQCPVASAKASYEALRPYGIDLSFESEPSLGHACARGRQRLCRQEIDRMSAILSGMWSGLSGIGV